MADAKQLPFDSNYDPVALEAYYSQRPLQLYARVAVVAGSIVKVAVACLCDQDDLLDRLDVHERRLREYTCARA